MCIVFPFFLSAKRGCFFERGDRIIAKFPETGAGRVYHDDKEQQNIGCIYRNKQTKKATPASSLHVQQPISLRQQLVHDTEFAIIQERLHTPGQFSQFSAGMFKANYMESENC